ncbi:MAG: cytochrome c oxidase subunit 3 [Deltaproteobacteria bacterium]|nr:cytochrome c oxidase subunit 3 [Deltaproteobacteria bacterium]
MRSSAVLTAAPARSGIARAPRIRTAVLGMLIFVGAEVMFFAGLVSAFVIARSHALGWPPPGQPRLPIAATALNTLVLLASGGVLLSAGRAAATAFGRRRALRRLTAAVTLGALFVAIQGVEWARLLAFGLTMRSSQYGSFFYLIVGVHAAHAVAAIAALLHARTRLALGTLSADAFAAVRVLWYFVVGVWPALYVVVYLA